MINDTVTYSNLRQNLKSKLDQVCYLHIPLHITRKNGEDVVILSKNDYSALTETAYLLSSPKNKKRLITALNRNKKDRKSFSDLNKLSHELGV